MAEAKAKDGGGRKSWFGSRFFQGFTGMVKDHSPDLHGGTPSPLGDRYGHNLSQVLRRRRLFVGPKIKEDATSAAQYLPSASA